MTYFSWDTVKNDWLMTHRGVSFEMAVFYIEHGGLLDILEHPNQTKYADQQIYVVQIGDYAYIVPFVKAEGTVILSRLLREVENVKDQ